MPRYNLDFGTTIKECLPQLQTSSTPPLVLGTSPLSAIATVPNHLANCQMLFALSVPNALQIFTTSKTLLPWMMELGVTLLAMAAWCDFRAMFI
jgi:hypothetical protein